MAIGRSRTSKKSKNTSNVTSINKKNQSKQIHLTIEGSEYESFTCRNETIKRCIYSPKSAERLMLNRYRLGQEENKTEYR